MAKRLKKIQIYNDMYDVYIIFLIGGDVPNLQRYIKRKHGKARLYSWDKEFDLYTDDADTTNGYQFHVNAPLGKGEVFYSWHSEMTPYLLSHELYHVVGDILYTRGIGYNYDSEEIYAYLYSLLFDKVFKKLGGKFPKRL